MTGLRLDGATGGGDVFMDESRGGTMTKASSKTLLFEGPSCNPPDLDGELACSGTNESSSASVIFETPLPFLSTSTGVLSLSFPLPLGDEGIAPADETLPVEVV